MPAGGRLDIRTLLRDILDIYPTEEGALEAFAERPAT